MDTDGVRPCLAGLARAVIKKTAGLRPPFLKQPLQEASLTLLMSKSKFVLGRHAVRPTQRIV